MKTFAILLAIVTYVAADGLKQVNCTGDCRLGDPNAQMTFVMKLKIAEFEKCVRRHECPLKKRSLSNLPCQNGRSGEYDCENVDMLAFVSLYDLGCNGDANDIWGWTDPETDKEYAIIGCYDGTSFVDVTDATKPVVIGFLPTHTTGSSWRDIKVYADHAFIGSEAYDHGLQVYDLHQLRGLQQKEDGSVNVLKEDTHYGEFGSSHNIVINEETGYLYSVGSRTCTSGLHVVNIRNPLMPEYAGCFGQDGYVHDAQCVVYKGKDTKYVGKEICFCYNENTLTIVDVEDKNNMQMLSRISYDGYRYTHQGWLNEEQTRLLMDDELDELYGSNPHTRTMVWNVEDLENPMLQGSFYSSQQATDHNLYIKGNLAYQSNYCAGLRILDVSNIEGADLNEVGYFDVAPDCSAPGFSGSWSNYPYFKSGNIIVSSIERGLFVLKYTGGQKA